MPRIGITSSLQHDDVAVFHRCPLLLARHAGGVARHGRSMVVDLDGTHADAIRVKNSVVAIVYGNDTGALARLLIRPPLPVLVLLVETAPAEGSPLWEAIQRVERDGRDVVVVELPADGVKGLDIHEGRVVTVIDSLSALIQPFQGTRMDRRGLPTPVESLGLVVPRSAPQPQADPKPRPGPAKKKAKKARSKPKAS